MTTLHNEGLKNGLKKVEMELGFLATPSRFACDDVMERKDELGIEDSDEEDVYVNQNGAIHDVTANEVLGKGYDDFEVMRKSRIVIGWNANVVDIMLVHISSQEMLCIIEDVQGKVKMFVSIWTKVVKIAILIVGSYDPMIPQIENDQDRCRILIHAGSV
ncbi:hypothetical protein Tco_0054167 [Tanacetum coccineum]